MLASFSIAFQRENLHVQCSRYKVIVLHFFVILEQVWSWALGDNPMRLQIHLKVRTLTLILSVVLNKHTIKQV